MGKDLYSKIENILIKCNSEYNTNYSVINVGNILHILDNTYILMKICNDFKIVSDKKLIDYVGFEYLKDIVMLLNSYIFKSMKINKYINYVNYTIYNETNLENTFIVDNVDYKLVVKRKIGNKELFYVDVINNKVNNVVDLNKEDSILFRTIELILEGNIVIYEEHTKYDNHILFDLIIYNTEKFKKSKYVNFMDNNLLLREFISFQNNILNIQDNYTLGFGNKFIIKIEDLDKFKQIIKNINNEYKENRTMITEIKDILYKTHYYADFLIEDNRDKIILRLSKAVLEYDKHINNLILNNIKDMNVNELNILYKDIKIIEDGLNKLYKKK